MRPGEGMRLHASLPKDAPAFFHMRNRRVPSVVKHGFELLQIAPAVHAARAFLPPSIRPESSNVLPRFAKNEQDPFLEFLVTRSKRLARAESNFGLRNDGARIDRFVHMVNRNSLRRGIEPTPKIGIGSPVPRKQGDMKVDRSAFQQIENGRPYDMPISVTYGKIDSKVLNHLFADDFLRLHGFVA